MNTWTLQLEGKMIMNLRECFFKFISEYSTVYSQVVNTENWSNPFGNFIRHEIPSTIRETLNTTIFKVEGSCGRGRWTPVPWVAVYDTRITNKASSGVYIVYLLNKDKKRLFLTLIQSVTEAFKNSSAGASSFGNTVTARDPRVLNGLRENAKLIQKELGIPSNRIETIDCGSPAYNAGCICSMSYQLEALPSNDQLLADLSEYLQIYSQYYDAFIAKKPIKLGSFDSWKIVDKEIAVKHCDKSFFEYNSSGIPKEIKWYFNAETLKPGETRDVILKYNGVTYTGKLSNDIRDSASIRWSESLGKLFDEWSSANSPAAWFRKKEGNVYEVMMKSEEKPMSTIKETINNIKAYIASKGFSYDGSLIENFYLSLKTKPFVILAGTSGTGKTKLVRLFAEAIGAEYQLVPVRPDWSDSSDLFGHVDLNGKFNEGIILPFVKKAELNPDKPYFLCLDEMNLARVEYYLSDVLSVIETREKSSDGRIITDALVPTETFGTDVRAKEKYGVVRLPENLYIVGTVNMDETTFPFSRKVLDRANTIEFSYVDMIPDFADKASDGKKQTLANEFLKTRYLVLTRNCADDAGYVTEVCEKLQTINEILKEADAHVGYRVRDEIAFYMLNNRKDGLLSEDEAFDNEIMQKILPRIHGGSSAVKNILQKLFKQLAGDYSGYAEDKATCEQMKAYLESKGTTYPKSAEKITYMIRRYEEDGFTSYWI